MVGNLPCHPLNARQLVDYVALHGGVAGYPEGDSLTNEELFAVEATVLLGLDNHDREYIERLVDFLLEIDLDLAEFTVITPFPHTRAFDELEQTGRILHHDWRRYTAGEVVIKPAQMTPDELQEMYHYAWDTFYKDESQAVKMAKVLRPVMLADARRSPNRRDRSGSRDVNKKDTWR